jgi:hypothetical protein
MIHRTAATHHSIALALLIVLVSAQGMAQNQKPPTADDVKVYKEAMGWFKKAEAMIGTLKENSEEQAELFRKALEIKSDFIEAYYKIGRAHV